MTDNQKVVIQWWHSDRNYLEGVNLLLGFSKRKILAASLAQKAERFGRAKLQYELPKSVNLDWKDMPKPTEENLPNPIINSKQPVDNPIPVSPEFASGKFPEIKFKEQDSDQYPKVIRRLVHEYSDSYRKRGTLHKQMAEVPADNVSPHNETRADLLAQIKDCSVHLDYLYGFIKNFQDNNIIPKEDEVWKTQPQPLMLTLEEAKKQRVNLQNANYKDNNRLLFQTSKKLEKQNPMPAGTKRKKIEIRMKKRNAEMSSLEELIIELQNAD